MTVFDDFFRTQMDYLSEAIDWRGLTVIEYGAQHARHSLALLGLGAKSATAVEGRQSNLDRVENQDRLPLKTVCADIRKLKKSLGKYDVGLILGVLYHLDQPVDFLRRELPRIGKHLFIWTHYVTAGSIEQGGYKGAPWGDRGEGESDAIEPMIDFWFEKHDLLRCLRANGFEICEVVDMPTPVSPGLSGMMVHAVRDAQDCRRVVIARYDENVDWAVAYPHLIYDKGGAPLDADTLNVVKLEENPPHRESHTYLHHIITHYDDLDDYTAFVQGDPFKHAEEFNQQWNVKTDFAWIGHWLVQDDRFGKPHHPDTIPVGAVYEHLFNRPAPPLFEFMAGAQFVASRERIRSKPLDFWRAVQGLAYDPQFTADIIGVHERLWGCLLNEPL